MMRALPISFGAYAKYREDIVVDEWIDANRFHFIFIQFSFSR